MQSSRTCNWRWSASRCSCICCSLPCSPAMVQSFGGWKRQACTHHHYPTKIFSVRFGRLIFHSIIQWWHWFFRKVYLEDISAPKKIFSPPPPNSPIRGRHPPSPLGPSWPSPPPSWDFQVKNQSPTPPAPQTPPSPSPSRKKLKISETSTKVYCGFFSLSASVV